MTQPMRAHRTPIIRAGLAILSAPLLATGGWAALEPVSWYRSYPGLGRAWVVDNGPFNHHLTVDAGIGFLAIGVVLLAAAAFYERRLAQVALVAFLVHDIPHALHHLANRGSQSRADWLLATGSLGLGGAIALALLLALTSGSQHDVERARPQTDDGAATGDGAATDRVRR